MSGEKAKVQLEKVNELFGLSPNDELQVKEKVQTPMDGFLIKMNHSYRGYDIWGSTAVVAQDDAGFLSEAGHSALFHGIDKLAHQLDFEHPPHPENSIVACQTHICETNLMPIITNAIVRHRWLYVYNRELPKPGPLVFADEVQVDGDTDQGLPFSSVLLYDTINKKVINTWNPSDSNPGSTRGSFSN